MNFSGNLYWCVDEPLPVHYDDLTSEGEYLICQVQFQDGNCTGVYIAKNYPEYNIQEGSEASEVLNNVLGWNTKKFVAKLADFVAETFSEE